jgi:uncharacterized protein (DUF1499 family)
MMKFGLVMLLSIAVFILLWIAVSFFYPEIFFRAEPEGLCHGKLPNKPNWVSSFVAENNPHYIASLGKIESSKLTECIQSHSGKRFSIKKEGSHWHGYRRTAFFGFTDWFCISSEGEVTSSATMGHSDMGVNRAWVEGIRNCLKK